jgi:hypothetical protein
LLLKGFEVFRAVSSACSCDLAILKEGMLKRIEVRTGRRCTNGKIYWPVKTEVENYDVLAIVLPDEIIYKPVP